MDELIGELVQMKSDLLAQSQTFIDQGDLGQAWRLMAQAEGIEMATAQARQHTTP